MVFNSLVFLVFLGVVFAIHHTVPSWTVRKSALLVASYVFYGAWNPPFTLLLAFSTLVDWQVARRLMRARGRQRPVLLGVSLFANFGLLATFKYGGFLLGNFTALAGMLGWSFHPMPWSVVLPVGISFYTFQTLSYTIDVYRGDLEAWDSFLDFALYVSFFPQLVAGPIVRASAFLPQCRAPHKTTTREIGWGGTLLLVGLFQKVVLADALMAPVADQVFGNAARAGAADAWIGTLAFSAQIFFDFAGYSTCAIGVALMLGFELPDNFRAPYAALGFSDFWRRWHVSLSTWLRDYLYVPLGGNRRGRFRTAGHLMTTMLLGGLWHGAAWRFVAWGGLHGCYLMAERRLRGLTGLAQLADRRATRAAMILATYGLVCFTWVFFRAAQWGDAVGLARRMVGLGVGSEANLILGVSNAMTVLVVTAALLAWHGWVRDTSFEERWQRLPIGLRVGLVGLMGFALLVTPGTNRAFIYFQF